MLMLFAYFSWFFFLPILKFLLVGVGVFYRAITLINAVPYVLQPHNVTVTSIIECAAKCNADFLSDSR